MTRSLTTALLAITLTLGCGGVALAQAPKPKPAQAKAVNPWGGMEKTNANRDLPIMFDVGQKGLVIDGPIPASTYKSDIRLYRFLAGRGNTKARYNLATMYEFGAGDAQNYVRAHMWFNLAATSSDKYSKAASTNRDNVAAKMTPAQIAEAQAMAHKCQASNFKQCD